MFTFISCFSCILDKPSPVNFVIDSMLSSKDSGEMSIDYKNQTANIH